MASFKSVVSNFSNWSPFLTSSPTETLTFLIFIPSNCAEIVFESPLSIVPVALIDLVKSIF